MLAVTALLLCISSCGTSRSTTKTGNSVHNSGVSGGHAVHKPADKDVAAALVTEAKGWLGVPYLWGGNDTTGVDCSGFLVAVYRDAAGIKLPRTTKLQQQHCLGVDNEERSVGDILFFSSKRSDGKVAHVGMYIGDNKMIHSSSSRGVVIDDLSMRYYQEHYLGVGRPPLLAEAHPIVKKNIQAETPAAMGNRNVALVNDNKKKGITENNSYKIVDNPVAVDTTLQLAAIIEKEQSVRKSDASAIYEPIVASGTSSAEAEKSVAAITIASTNVSAAKYEAESTSEKQKEQKTSVARTEIAVTKEETPASIVKNAFAGHKTTVNAGN